MNKTMKKLFTALICAAFAALLAFGIVGCSFGETSVPQWLEQQTCNHEWDDGEVTKEPTCTEVGERTLTCWKCEKTKKEEVALKNHKYVLLYEEAGSCTSGKVEYYECAFCGSVQSVREETLGHTPETVTGTSATCTEDGLTDGEICTVCGETLTAQTVIPATGHSIEWCILNDESHSGVCTNCDFTTVITAHSYAWKVGETQNRYECKCGKVGLRDGEPFVVTTADDTAYELHIEQETFDLTAALGGEEAEIVYQIGMFELEILSFTFNGQDITAAFANDVEHVPVSVFGNARGEQVVEMVLFSGSMGGDDYFEHVCEIKFNIVESTKPEAGVILQVSDYEKIADYTGRRLRLTWDIGVEDVCADDLMLLFGDEEQGFEIGVMVALTGNAAGADLPTIGADQSPDCWAMHDHFFSSDDCHFSNVKSGSVEGITFKVTRDETHIYCDIIFADVVTLTVTNQDGSTETATYDVLKCKYFCIYDYRIIEFF